MLCRKFKTVLLNKTTNSHVVYRPLVPARAFSKWFDVFSKTNPTSCRAKLLQHFVVTRFLYGWAKSFFVNAAVRRCRRERGVREVFQYFRHVFFKPRRTHLLVTVTAAYKRPDEKPNNDIKCDNIKDQDMENLIGDLDDVEELSKATLFCQNCCKRVIIDHKHPGVRYCSCENSKAHQQSFDGWVPYMEAEDVVIWRKEYKPGGLYAYKVYGRYKDVHAKDFAMIQVDGAYRKVWDAAVASVAVVERDKNGVKDQLVLHWEVLWPRLFANRDYVYLRRHKEFSIQSRFLVHKDNIFEGERPTQPKVDITERPCVHSHAKRISLANEMSVEAAARRPGAAAGGDESVHNKVYVIVSRSCVHPNVPETKNAIRVVEYWSHMVITTLNGPDEPGMEFVLTYYDEPAVGGLPTAITAWAMGRAGPAFLHRMRAAAAEYRPWLLRAAQKGHAPPLGTEKISFHNDAPVEDSSAPVSEQDMESSKQGPELDTPESKEEHRENEDIKEQGAQTDPVVVIVVKDAKTVLNKDTEGISKEEHQEVKKELEQNAPSETSEKTQITHVLDKDSDTGAPERDGDSDDKDGNTNRWWRYLYPFYYFV